MTGSGPISQALASAVQAAQLKPQDAAAVALCESYAALLDADGETLPDLGPKLLRALESLGLTPAGRGAKGGDSPGARIAAQLDEFTARRARKHGS